MSEKPPLAQARPDRRVTLTLSPAALAGGIVSLCAGFVLVFSLGVLLGRGYNLEERIPKLERILPEPATFLPPRIIAEGEAAQERHIPTPGPDTAGNENDRRTGVIHQGDLASRDNLRQPASPPRPAGTGGQTNQRPASRNAGRNDANAALDSRPLEQNRELAVQSGASSPAASGDNQVYHYVYQLAAYRSEAPCRAFVDRLQRDGFRARVEASGSDGAAWYRALLDFTGRADETDALREAMMKNYGIQRVLMRSKTPAR